MSNKNVTSLALDHFECQRIFIKMVVYIFSERSKE
jgi:hypothetical protein